MSVLRLSVEGYRSIKDLWLDLGRVNVLVGPNGCGKSNLYRALYLLTAAASGQFARSLAQEGGMPSALWAGRRSKGPVQMHVKVKLSNLKYELAAGLPIPSMSMFNLDPEIKTEQVWVNDGGDSISLLRRDHQSVVARDAQGKRMSYQASVAQSESVLSELREPHRFPELSALRQEFLNWRFYHQFRTDASSPLRQPQVGFRTPVISNDGINLAAALQTIREIGDSQALDEAIAAAFPGAALEVQNSLGQFSISMQMPGFQRPFSAQELSDGTLQYLCLLAALLSPRPPELLALNEPETSIHPDLFEPLARLIGQASSYSQMWITTHSRELADFILEHTGAVPIELEKVEGATRVVGQRLSNDD